MLSGIIASTHLEAGQIVQRLNKPNELVVYEKTFYQGILGINAPAVICICGVGKANAAHGATLLIEQFKPSIVYIIGVAGAYPSSELDIGEVVIAEKEIYGDEGVLSRDGFHTTEAINLPLLSLRGISYFNEFPLLIPQRFRNLKKGAFVTVSTCTGRLDRAREIEKQFHPLCENMEGAAVAHICTLYRIPAVEMRGISNIIGDRDPGPLNRSDILLAADNVQRVFLERLL